MLLFIEMLDMQTIMIDCCWMSMCDAMLNLLPPMSPTTKDILLFCIYMVVVGFPVTNRTLRHYYRIWLLEDVFVFQLNIDCKIPAANHA